MPSEYTDEQATTAPPANAWYWIAARLPGELPRGWGLVCRTTTGAVYAARCGLVVVVHGAVESDGQRWLHVTCCRTRRLPTWEELRAVKDLFLGVHCRAHQDFPPKPFWAVAGPKSHPACLHIAACVDADPLPNFDWRGE